MTTVSIVLQSLLVLYYAFSGIAKAIGANYWVDMFRQLGLPQWFRIVTGFVQLVGAAALIVGYWYSGSAAWAGIWLGITMLIACLTHVKAKDPFAKAMPALVFAIINIVVISLNVDQLMHPFTS